MDKVPAVVAEHSNLIENLVRSREVNARRAGHLAQEQRRSYWQYWGGMGVVSAAMLAGRHLELSYDLPSGGVASIAGGMLGLLVLATGQVNDARRIWKQRKQAMSAGVALAGLEHYFREAQQAHEQGNPELAPAMEGQTFGLVRVGLRAIEKANRAATALHNLATSRGIDVAALPVPEQGAAWRHVDTVMFGRGKGGEPLVRTGEVVHAIGAQMVADLHGVRGLAGLEAIVDGDLGILRAKGEEVLGQLYAMGLPGDELRR